MRKHYGKNPTRQLQPWNISLSIDNYSLFFITFRKIIHYQCYVYKTAKTYSYHVVHIFCYTLEDSGRVANRKVQDDKLSLVLIKPNENSKLFYIDIPHTWHDRQKKNKQGRREKARGEGVFVKLGQIGDKMKVDLKNIINVLYCLRDDYWSSSNQLFYGKK